MGLTYNGDDGTTKILVETLNKLEKYIDAVNKKTNEANDRLDKLEKNQVLVDTLTKREQEVLERLKKGTPTKDIAQELGVSGARVSTIKRQLKNKGLIV